MNSKLYVLIGLLLGLAPLSVVRGQLIPNGTYNIVEEDSGLSMGSTGTTDGSSVTDQTYAGLSTQKWTITNLGSNVVEIVVSGTSEALQPPTSEATGLGANLVVSAYTGATYQQWQIVSVGSGNYEIVNMDSTYMCYLSYYSLSPGANICQYFTGTDVYGNWSFTAVSTTGATGSNSVVFNYETTASGSNTAAFNDNTVAGAYDETVFGRFNVGGVASGGATSWNIGDPLLEVGNGTSSTSTSDAFIIYKNGDAALEGTLEIAPGGDIPMYTGS